MYTYEQRMKAVQLYIKYYHKASLVIRELGYPNRHQLVKWYNEYEANGTLRNAPLPRAPKYSPAQKRAAIEFYNTHGNSAALTVRILGYPGISTMKRWINEAFPDREKYCTSGGTMVEFPHQKKEQAVIDLCTRTESAEVVAKTHEISRATLYKWKKQLFQGEGEQTMPWMNKSKKEAVPSIEQAQAELASLRREIDRQNVEVERLHREVHRLQLQRDLLEKAGEIPKKEEGVNLELLTNREKAELIDALRNRYRLPELLPELGISKSSYYYQANRLHTPDKYEELRQLLKELFVASGRCYGYRRLHALLVRAGQTVSEKVVRRLMLEEGLAVPNKKRRKYNSYAGEITPAVKNILNRNFSADAPNEKWVTDITEFSIPAGKVYLSPVIDCFDGLAVAWTIGTSPSAELTNTMLDKAILSLKDDEHPVIHSDRGCHYRWPGWISRTDSAGLVRSMSRKGCSPDNSACEGFFGRIKNEMFYNRSWQDVSIDEFIQYLDNYLEWYNLKRIKESLGWLSPIEYRRSLGLEY